MKATRLCTFPGCDRPLSSRGLCVGHVYQLRKGYDLTPIKPRRTGCDVDDCAADHYALGYCQTHYGRLKANGDPLTTKTGGTPKKAQQPCAVEGCDRPARKSRVGMCNSHHHRLERYGDPLENRASPWLDVPFWDRVNITDDADSCWEWLGPLNGGRGRLMLNGRHMMASRAAWEMTNGPIPDGLFVCHRCDNPPCVRPDHLFLGTPQDNTDDMWRKGRARPGRGNPQAGDDATQTKLSDARVREMRARHAAGATQAQLVREYGLSQSQTSRILNGQSRRSTLNG